MPSSKLSTLLSLRFFFTACLSIHGVFAARSLDYVDIDWRHVFENCVETEARNATFFPPLSSVFRGQLVRDGFQARVAFCAVANMRCYTKTFHTPDSEQPVRRGTTKNNEQPVFFAGDRYELRDISENASRALDVFPAINHDERGQPLPLPKGPSSSHMAEAPPTSWATTLEQAALEQRPQHQHPPLLRREPRPPSIRERPCRVSSVFAGCPGGNGFYSLLAAARHRERNALPPALVVAVEGGATRQQYLQQLKKFGLARFVHEGSTFGKFLTPEMGGEALRRALCPDGPPDFLEEDIPYAISMELFLSLWRMCRPRYWHKVTSGRLSQNASRQTEMIAFEALARKQMHLGRLGYRKDVLNKTGERPLLNCPAVEGMINRRHYFPKAAQRGGSYDLRIPLDHCAQFYQPTFYLNFLPWLADLEKSCGVNCLGSAPLLQVVGEDDRRNTVGEEGGAAAGAVPSSEGAFVQTVVSDRSRATTAPSRLGEDAVGAPTPSVPFVPLRLRAGRRTLEGRHQFTHNCKPRFFRPEEEAQKPHRPEPCIVERHSTSSNSTLEKVDFFSTFEKVEGVPDSNTATELPAFELLWQTAGQKRLLDPGPPWFREFAPGLFDPSKKFQTHPRSDTSGRRQQWYLLVDGSSRLDLGLKYVPVLYGVGKGTCCQLKNTMFVVLVRGDHTSTLTCRSCFDWSHRSCFDWSPRDTKSLRTRMTLSGVGFFRCIDCMVNACR